MKKNLFILASFMLLWGCGEKKPALSFEPKKSVLSALDKTALVWPSHFSYPRLMSLIEEGNLKEASKYVNIALQISPQSAPLHLVNGFIYEEMTRSGDDSRKELAGVAYRTAVRHDPTQWISSYLLGTSELKERNYADAQQNLANALLLNPNNPDILYSLAYASYYLRDIPVALSSIKKAVSLCSNSPAIVRSAIVICAAAGDFQNACAYLKTYQKLVGCSEEDVKVVQRRIDDWRSIHGRARICRTAATKDAEGLNSKQGEALSDFQEFQKKSEAASKSESDDSVIIDCYMLRTSETDSSLKGNNIFESLAINLGAGTAAEGIASFSRSLYRGNFGQPVGGSWTKAFSYAVSPVALSYSLNIMNAKQVFVEVIGRPTIATLVGKPAYFLQGDQYTGTSSGSTTGAVISSVDAGTKIEVIPREITPQGLVVLEVTLTGSLFPELPDRSKGATGQLFVLTRSKVTTIVKAHLGQTVMLGGLYSRTNTSSKSGFPVLQDIPIVQYFFAQGATTSDTRCILYLLTPRRGGSSSDCYSQKNQPSVAHRLKQRGLMSIGEYSSFYYILKGLSRSDMISGFRSGDLPEPFWGYHTASLSKKLEQIRSFLWY